MQFQDSSFNGLKVTVRVGTKSVTDASTHSPKAICIALHQLFQSWGHNKEL